MSAPIDLVAEIKRRKRTTPRSADGRSTAPTSREPSGAGDRESEFALSRSARYSLAGALGLDEPDSPDDVLDALDERAAVSGAPVCEDSSPSGIDTAGMSGDQLGEDAIGERLHRHHELARPQPAVSEMPRGSAQLAPAHLRRPGRPRPAAATEPLRQRLTRTRVKRRRLFGVLAVAGIAAALAATVVLISGESSAPRHERQTLAARPSTVTAGSGQSRFSLMARIHGEVADEARAAARLTRERAQRQARRRRERAQRHKRALARKRAAARSHANREASTSASTSESDGATTSSLTAPSTVTVTTPAVASSSSSSSSDSDPGSAGPTGVGSSSGGCDPKCR